MVGFFSRHLLLHRSRVRDHRLRTMRVRLEKMRGVNSRVRRTLEAWQIAAAAIEMRNWVIMGENELLFLVNALADQWVIERLVELENDPLLRNAFEIIYAGNRDGSNIVNGNQAQPLQEDGAAGRPP